MRILSFLLAAVTALGPAQNTATAVLFGGDKAVPVRAPLSDLTASPGDVIDVPVLLDRLVADVPEGVRSVQMMLRYNATMLTPSLTLQPGDFKAAYSPVRDGVRTARDTIQRRLTATVTFDPPLQPDAAGMLCAFRFTVKGEGTPVAGFEPGTCGFALDSMIVNGDPTFQTQGRSENKLVVRTQRLVFRVVVNPLE